jgi:hypothetical protein
MKIPTLIALILLYAAASAAANVFHIYLPSLLLSLSLAIGVLMEPIRVYQAVSGKFYDQLDAPKDKLKLAMRWFYAAFPFWLGLAWTTWNVAVVKSCSGDNCLGYTLLAMPFPFLYVAGEISLFRARKK